MGSFRPSAPFVNVGLVGLKVRNVLGSPCDASVRQLLLVAKKSLKFIFGEKPLVGRLVANNLEIRERGMGAMMSERGHFRSLLVHSCCTCILAPGTMQLRCVPN